jgi:two-component system, NtrC family, sensor kinase
MSGNDRRIGRTSHFVVFRSVRNKLLTLMILLSLVPLSGIAILSYHVSSKQIAEDRIKLSLEKMAQDTADKIDLMLRQRKEEIHSMATTFPLIYPSLKGADPRGIIRLLNNYCFNHEIYDLLVIADNQGHIVSLNTMDRYGNLLPAGTCARILEGKIDDFPEEKIIFGQSVTGHSSHHDWYQSKLVQSLYDYKNEDESHQYNIALSEPIRNPATHEIIGVWINILNWYWIQTMLENVELDLGNLDLRTGYAFMFAKDGNTIIGHKYRKNRSLPPTTRHYSVTYPTLYNMRLIENLGLRSLFDAIAKHQHSHAYEFPPGNKKISGLAPIDDTSFGWIVGVGIDGADIFRPINRLTWWLVGVTLSLALLVVGFTYMIARGITNPLKSLIQTSRIIAQGNLSQRVEVRSSDEIGILGATFNDMARALEAREGQLQDLNRNLEKMVRLRTSELENSHDALKKAYVDLQGTQEQLVQTEKMASLGQLVAGIAHEIKNPLNFIYGNTGFLADYTNKLQALIDAYDSLSSLSAQDRDLMRRLKEECNYAFLREDLRTLIDNFSEGARRINNIVSDLRAFSRIDTGRISEIDLHASLEMSLNLLRNQYKDRIAIHCDFGNVPKIQGYIGKLNQVFMNLLSNAFHAVKEKGDVWIRTRFKDGMVEVEIEDNGVGIPKEHLHRIFEPFFTTKPIGQGTGLGLSISYGIVEQHRGKIQVSSIPGKGSIFTVWLPIFQEQGES